MKPIIHPIHCERRKSRIDSKGRRSLNSQAKVGRTELADEAGRHEDTTARMGPWLGVIDRAASKTFLRCRTEAVEIGFGKEGAG